MRPSSVVALLICGLSLPTPAVGAAERPNIVVILVDDMGWSDISCYGGEIPTPNIDALANNGLRFTQFYNTGRCCPTRASLLTGQYSHQVGIGDMTGDKGPKHPGYRGFLNHDCVTLGEVLRPAGYATLTTGKWHVGHKDPSMRPLQRGFDRYYGVPEGGGFYYRPKKGRSILLDNDVLYTAAQLPPEDWYTTDAWTDFGLKFVNEAIDAKRPFLLYLAHNAPHFPLQAPDADIERYRGQYMAGWDDLRAARFARQKEMGLISADWGMSPRPDAVVAWESLSNKEQRDFDQIMAIYAAVMDRMDQSVGRLVQGLKERGVLDNTLILFMSDNGGTAEGGPRGRMNGTHPGDADSDVYYGQPWATLSNTPFRRYKMHNHEGGIATPLIAHWPQQIKAAGELRHQVCHVIDIMPTLVEVSGAAYPSERAGHSIYPMEGVSLLPAFRNEQLSDRPLFWEHEGAAAVRDGDWKLVRAGAKSDWELYNLITDRTELHNLADQHPERARQLKQQWLAWAERVHVIGR
ncbi:MAG: arylsulfatase [Planctomycetaceae bacterium]|nr:arylsulfatase [Planctomycetaceae bacterium]